MIIQQYNILFGFTKEKSSEKIDYKGHLPFVKIYDCEKKKELFKFSNIVYVDNLDQLNSFLSLISSIIMDKNKALLNLSHKFEDIRNLCKWRIQNVSYNVKIEITIYKQNVNEEDYWQ